MSAISLQKELAAALEESARQEAATVDELLNKAVAQYLRARQREKLDREIEAFAEMHDDLRSRMLGQWVAIHDGRLVDHDPDGSRLYQRIRARYGRTSVLLRQVSESPTEEIHFRTAGTGNSDEDSL